MPKIDIIQWEAYRHAECYVDGEFVVMPTESIGRGIDLRTLLEAIPDVTVNIHIHLRTDDDEDLNNLRRHITRLDQSL